MTTESLQIAAPRVARFRDLKPSKKTFSVETVGVPGEAYEMIAAHSVFPLMAPAGNKRKAASPGIIGTPGLEVVIAVCPPGQGPALHAHNRTTETFICITGRFEITGGMRVNSAETLDPCDILSVPPGYFRRFRNVSDEAEAKLLVLVQGKLEDTFNDVSFDPKLVPVMKQKWGGDVIDNFLNIGITFGPPACRKTAAASEADKE
jgi:quercetin dioxygenase-like cupin family protein